MPESTETRRFEPKIGSSSRGPRDEPRAIVSHLPRRELPAHGRGLLNHGEKQAKHHQNRESRCDDHNLLPNLLID